MLGKAYLYKKLSSLACIAGAAAASVVFPLSGYAQAVVVGAGYALPQPVNVAPGQVITLFVRVPGKTQSDPAAAIPPVPALLGGFSGILRQTYPSDPVTVPILSTSDIQSCSNLAPPQCDTISLVTVQIPFELTPNLTAVPRVTIPANFARLELSYNGDQTTSMPLSPVTDSIHVLNSCDVVANLPGNCLPVVKHADGTLVARNHPAQTGEVLSVDVVGLGQPSSSIATGAATPATPPSVDGVRVYLDTRANGAPTVPLPASATAANSAQLLAGAVGIYELTFTVPSLPPSTPLCGTMVHSNLTVSVGRYASYDGVGICVDPNLQ